ncbi:MAG: phenylacetate-CoA oxygenase subunit PaaJ [Nocardioides sp.]|nr:phenylacetate-CoA oxygenase subunit PaaJ [Nocardioides sp.]
MSGATTTRAARAREVAATVLDPEVPVLTIDDLGILREVSVDDDGVVHVDLTPTYSGCPAVEAIESDVETALVAAGFADVRVRRVLAPAWTTDRISDDGRRKLLEYGIAPPSGTRPVGPVPVQLGIRCPQCGSPRTSELSRFGSTACKSLWRCDDCREPFDHFKVLR